MAVKVAIYGFKHGHINSVVRACQRLDHVELVACAEDDASYREPVEKALGIEIKPISGEQLIDNEEFDVFACGDAYGNRGRLLLRALDAGKHLLCDKPLCTRREEAEAIAAGLQKKGLEATVMFTLRYRPVWAGVQRLIADGTLGALRTLHAFGPHPLRLGERPEWYWTPELHGGIINDLQCHGIDLMRWFSGRELERPLYATVGNAHAPQVPSFEDHGQCLLLFEGGAKFGGEVNYMQPPGGHAVHWEILGWTERGQFRLHDAREVHVDHVDQGAIEVEPVELPHPDPASELLSYLEHGGERLITTEDALRSSFASLDAQAAAEWV